MRPPFRLQWIKHLVVGPIGSLMRGTRIRGILMAVLLATQTFTLRLGRHYVGVYIRFDVLYAPGMPIPLFCLQ